MRSWRSLENRLSYRVASVDDAAVVVSLMTEGISRWVAAWPFPLSFDQARSILESMTDQSVSSEVHPFIVSEKKAAHDIGWLKIAASDRCEACWEIGYWIGEDFQGRGFAKDIARFALSYCFDRLRADRVLAGAQVDNLVSLNLLDRIGMDRSHTQTVYSSARGRFEECEYKSICRDRFEHLMTLGNI